MKKYSYYKTSISKKIRFIKYLRKNSDYIVFLHGFMSDIEGKKPKAFLNFAKKNKIGFLALEYTGHGKSSGKFVDGNISIWTNDAKLLIKKIIKKNNFFLIGSSMGAWISLILFQFFKNQIKGFLGIGSAPEFLDKLMWNKFTKKMKRDLKKNGFINLKHGNYQYPITHQLIKDGRKNKVLNKKINQNINVTMIHGSKDESVPQSFSKKILKIFPIANKKLVILKNGDHSLSDDKWIKVLKKELKLIIN
ncbi:alpha/beta hydrolase [Candidatus Pelagibacter sp.]|nr:alpha/beta hydrolase [Candidatus Pelagibacter sp.]